MSASGLFTIPDLCYHIVHIVAAGGHRSVNADLASLARVSTQLSVPALDALWRSIESRDGIDKLLRLLPVDAVSSDRTTEIHISRPLEPSDLVVLNKYAFRVQEFAYSDYGSPELFQLCAVQHTPLFPCLRALTWSSLSKNHMPIPVLCSSLESLCITIFRETGPSGPIAPNLPSLAPNLVKFQLFTRNSTPRIHFAASRAIQSLPLLEHIELDFYIDSTLLLYLSTAASLSRLHFCSVIINGIPFPQFQPDSFPSLEELHVTGSLYALNDLLRHMSSTRLRELGITPEGPQDIRLEKLFPLIAAQCPSLSDFTLYPSAIRHCPIASLYGCQSLQNVKIDTPSFDVINDASLEAAAEAWPNLRSLFFTWDGDETTPDRPQTTLYALRHFAQHCPVLTDLHIAIDATAPPPSTQFFSAARPSPSRLEYLGLAHSPCGTQYAWIASFITHAFPQLLYFDAEQPPRQAYGAAEGNWANVVELLPVRIQSDIGVMQ